MNASLPISKATIRSNITTVATLLAPKDKIKWKYRSTILWWSVSFQRCLQWRKARQLAEGSVVQRSYWHLTERFTDAALRRNSTVTPLDLWLDTDYSFTPHNFTSQIKQYRQHVTLNNLTAFSITTLNPLHTISLTCSWCKLTHIHPQGYVRESGPNQESCGDKFSSHHKITRIYDSLPANYSVQDKNQTVIP
jgi:hypothetical protein